ncbi:binding partner of ACD11 1 [Canna indica]|uniref:Binding partner of ACD11 1 n=1 Tax=Canna indica TaxID=4628 RepID=A0AAQ3QE79_9LILI|nr:binding partner of ACD11 1 [Canna indica]
MTVTTVKINNVSLHASMQDIDEFFSFSGEIIYVEMERVDEFSQVAYVTYKDEQGAETALLLTGAKIMDLFIDITTAPDYELPANASVPLASKDGGEAVSGIGLAVQRAENVVSTMLAKGFILGKDALNKAKTFDEKHQLTSTATAKVSDFDKKIGLREKISTGAAVVNEKVTEMDQKYQVSEKTRSAIAAAEQKVSTAGAAIMKNRYVFTGATWVTGAFNRVAKAASDVGSKAADKSASEQEARAVNGVGSEGMDMALNQQETWNGNEVELRVIDKALSEQEASNVVHVQLKAVDKAGSEQEAQDGVEVELKAVDKAGSEQEAQDGAQVELKAVDKAVNEQDDGTEIELKAVDKAGSEQEARDGAEVELRAVDKAASEEEAQDGTEGEPKAVDKAASEQEARPGNEAESNVVTRQEQNTKDEDDHVSDTSKDASIEHHGKPEPAQ